MDDLISRQAAIEAVEKGKPTSFINKDGSIDLFGAGRQDQWRRDGIAIMNLPSAQRWIPVEERTPKPYEMVLITIIRKDERYNHIPFTSVGYIGWNNQAWWCAHDGDCKSANVEVLAWQPIPQTYERSEDE